MNTVEKLENLFKKSQEAQIAAQNADQDFDLCLHLKVMSLHAVGRSVLRKRLGDDRFRRLDDRHIKSPISRSLAWLINPSPAVSLRPARGRQTNSELIIGHYAVSIYLLQQSDRDFAKQIRESLAKSIVEFETWEYEQAKNTIERIERRRNKNVSRNPTASLEAN